MTSDISTNAAIAPAAGVTIDGNNMELKFVTNIGAGANSAEGLNISNEGITIKNLVIDTPTHGDNGIEIYRSATLENVTVKGSKKAGIYVNNDGTGAITVNFKDITTSGNEWEAGIGLVAQQLGSSIIANFTGTNSLGEAVKVYSEQGTSSNSSLYAGTVTVNKAGQVIVGTENVDKTYQTNYEVN